MDPYAEIAAISAGLVVLACCACLLPGVIRVLLIGQSAYWAMSYIARPLVLLTTRPEPRFGDNVADPRLAAMGYDRGIAAALQPVAYGILVYAGLVAALTVWARKRRWAASDSRMAGQPELMATLGVIYLIGSLGRIASILTGTVARAGEVQTASPALSLITLLASIGSLGLIVLIRPARSWQTVAVIAGLTVGELLWTVAIESKTPIMGAALAIAIRFAMTGWNRTKTIAVVTIAVVAIGAFGALQSLKETPELKAQAASANSAYPPSVQPFLGLLRRFDLLEAATDACFAGPGSWLSPGQVLSHGVASLLPAQVLGSSKMQAGTAWAEQIRGGSVDMSEVSVSLAEGNINEGYVLGGAAGVTVEVIFTFVILLLWAAALSGRRIVPIVLGLALSENPVVFERGILGTFEVIGKYLQAVVLIWIIHLAVVEFQHRRAVLVAPPVPAAVAK
ncbi:hypothetical protein ACIP5Y_23445 [Nocardia sp. NPDC088792]|uniref:hypothetical protein n=1 Tax=Nocardia sp. NPDC088792 TaxID=3364332 RepID=UPI0038104D90